MEDTKIDKTPNVHDIIRSLNYERRVANEICDTLELYIRRVEKSTGKTVAIILNHNENKLQIKQIENE
jgi:hypothetical protein